jgi:hypothetical protein
MTKEFEEQDSRWVPPGRLVQSGGLAWVPRAAMPMTWHARHWPSLISCRLLGVPQVGPIRRSPTQMLQAFAHLARSLGTKPLTTTVVRDSLGSGGLARLRKCGGIASVRAEIDRLSGRNGQAV